MSDLHPAGATRPSGASFESCYQSIYVRCAFGLVPGARGESTDRQLTEVYHNSDFQLTGISVSKQGRLFITIEKLVSDPRLQWPDTFSEGPDGSIYITASHINDSPTYNEGKSTRKAPYAAFKFTL